MRLLSKMLKMRTRECGFAQVALPPAAKLTLRVSSCSAGRGTDEVGHPRGDGCATDASTIGAVPGLADLVTTQQNRGRDRQQQHDKEGNETWGQTLGVTVLVAFVVASVDSAVVIIRAVVERFEAIADKVGAIRTGFILFGRVPVGL